MYQKCSEKTDRGFRQRKGRYLVEFTKIQIAMLGRGVCGSRVPSDAMRKIDSNNIFQRGEVQLRLLSIMSSWSASETGVGDDGACGNIRKKSAARFRDKASATVLSLPARCWARCSKWKCASKKNKHLSRWDS